MEDLSPKRVAADKAYDTNVLVAFIEHRGAEVVIHPKPTDCTTAATITLQKRNLVERFFCRIKHFRRIAIRYEKFAARFSAFIHITASLVWLE